MRGAGEDPLLEIVLFLVALGARRLYLAVLFALAIGGVFYPSESHSPWTCAARRQL
jgi:hypothetical protein